MSKLSNLEILKSIVSNGNFSSEEPQFRYPPPIAKTLGFNLVAVGPGTATIEILADIEKHGNPRGTVHGGVLCDIAEAAIGTAHITTLRDGETFTSVDLQINFHGPVRNEVIRAVAKTVNPGRIISRYICDIVRGDGTLVAQVTSTVMTLSFR